MDQMKCYNTDCSNMVDYSEKSSAFCSDECKAKYYGTTVEFLAEKPRDTKRRDLKEWIRFFKSGEAHALYHEIAKRDNIIVEKSPKETILAETLDFLSTPLGAEYARKSATK